MISDMGINRRELFRWTAAPWLAPRLFGCVAPAGLGDVVFCRVSDARLLGVARAIFPGCIASYEPRPGFRGITICGAKATLTLSPDRLS